MLQTGGRREPIKEDGMFNQKRLRNLLLGTVFTALSLPVAVYSADRVVIDEWDTNFAFSPMYARVMDNGVSDYVPIVFYRNPECVRPDFDLLHVFDVPAAFYCLPLTMEGFSIFEDAANIPLGVPPFQAKFSGDEVPMAFVDRETYNVIAADGLTIGDFTADMWGTATSYKEVLQPSPDANVFLLNIVAEGALDQDGTQFRLRVTAQAFSSTEIAERVFSLKFY
jgi:hypothetical protein